MFDAKNRSYWYIVKGVSIVSIVMGHSSVFLARFVYLYHLIIFFFLAGFLYSEKKYGDNPDINFLSKFKKNWIKCCGFYVFFLLLHNLLFRFGLIINTQKYNISQLISKILNSLFFYAEEDFSSALWFVPVLIIAMTIFGIIIYISRKIKYYKNDNNDLKKNIFIVISSILLGAIGLYLNYKKIVLIFHAETAFLAIPFVIIAYFIRTYIKDINKVLKIWIFIPSLLTLLFCAFFKVPVNLGDRILPPVYLFYLASLCGIYFCLYLSKIIYKIKYINKYFELLGKYSFEIMACHFLVIKLIDFIYAIIKGISDPMVYGVFPYAFSNLWPLYIILGCSIPALFFLIINNLKEKKKQLKEVCENE